MKMPHAIFFSQSVCGEVISGKNGGGQGGGAMGCHPDRDTNRLARVHFN